MLKHKSLVHLKISFINIFNYCYHQNYINVLGLISQIIGIGTLRLTLAIVKCTYLQNIPVTNNLMYHVISDQLKNGLLEENLTTLNLIRNPPFM